MKLRCTTDSIRIRIRKSELDTFAKEGAIHDQVRFPDGQVFRFSLKREGTGDLSAQWSVGNLSVLIPSAFAEKWMQPDRVELEAQLPLAAGEGALHILIEKDFPCLHREQEDKSDTFQDLADRKGSE